MLALALEFSDLMAQDEDLGVLGAIRAAELCCSIQLPIDPASWATITMAVCQRCGGRGRVPWVCVRCNGTGKWWAQPVYGMFTREYTCLLCHGRGRGEERCARCIGTGQVVARYYTQACQQCYGRKQIEVDAERYPSGLVRKRRITCPRCRGSGIQTITEWGPILRDPVGMSDGWSEESEEEDEQDWYAFHEEERRREEEEQERENRRREDDDDDW